VLTGDEFVSEPAFFNEQNFFCCEEQPCLEVRGEYLCFQTTWDQAHYVISARDNFFDGEHHPIGRRHLNNPPYKSGFRVETTYMFQDRPNDLDLRFTWLQSSHTSRVVGPVLWDTKGFPGDGTQRPEDIFYDGFAQDSVNFHYYGGDLTFNRISAGCCGENLSFLVGLHFAYIKFRENFISAGTYVDDGVTVANSNNLVHTSRFWGIGPEFGVDYKYDFWDIGQGSLTFVANARAALLASNTKPCFSDVTSRTGPDGVHLSNDTLWRVTPTFDARLGLSYNFGCASFIGALEVGYEMLWYGNAIDQITGLDVAYAGSSIDLHSNLNAQGPYVALTFGF